MSVLDPVEGLLESFSIPFAAGFWDGAMTADGRIVEFSGDREFSREVLRVYDLAMRQVDSVLLEAEEFELSDPGIFVQDVGGAHLPFAVPYYPLSVRYLDPSGAVWSKPRGDPDYVIQKWLPNGDTSLVLETHRPPVPVTASDRDSSIARLRVGIRRSETEATLDWSRIPEVKSAVKDVFVFSTGDLWVRTPSVGAQTRFDVYSSAGAFRGIVVAPPDLTHPAVVDDAL